MVLILSSSPPLIPDVGASFDEVDGMPSSVSSGFVCLVSNISESYRLQLASSIYA